MTTEVQVKPLASIPEIGRKRRNSVPGVIGVYRQGETVCACATEGGLQRLRAFIVLGDAYRDGDAVVAALMRRMRDELKPRALRPDRIEIVSGLASSPNGKLRRRELAAAVAGRRIGAQRGVVPI
jgi:acyl-CoA synthetase (AMP-forming)/AMP-acid ligase II